VTHAADEIEARHLAERRLIDHVRQLGRIGEHEKREVVATALSSVR
jgi:hypothetical protein